MNELYALVNDLDTPITPLDELAQARIRRRVSAAVTPRKRSFRALAVLVAAVLALSIGGYAAVNGSFSSWFWNLSQNLRAPEETESLFAQLGTTIGQSQTVGDVTMTLDGALWDGTYLYLSLSVEGLGNGQGYGTSVGSKKSWLNGSKEQVLAALRSHYPEVSEEELQSLWEGTLPFKQPEIRYIYHRKSDTYTLQVSRKLESDAAAELTLHLEELDFGGMILSEPFDFTFTITPKDLDISYTGETVVQLGDLPDLHVSALRISPFSAEVDFTTAEALPENALRDVAIHTLRLETGEETTGSSGSGLHHWEDENGIHHYTLSDGPFRQVADPRAVTAISIGETWLEVAELTKK